MTMIVVILGLLALLFALATILFGRNLTRSIMAGYASVGLLGLVLTLSGLGFAAMAMCTMAMMGLASIQVFGWMLVDVDRDHLAPTDAPTWIARVLAVCLIGGGITILMYFTWPLVMDQVWFGSPSVNALGEWLFGGMPGVIVLLGIAMATALLATMLLLRRSGEGH